MDDLRWALAIVAILAIAGIYGWELFRRRGKRSRAEARASVGEKFNVGDLEPMPMDTGGQDGLDLADLGGIVPEPDDGPGPERARADRVETPAGGGGGAPGAPGMTVALTVMAPLGEFLEGRILRSALDGVDMCLGADGLFVHYGVGDRKTAQPVFIAVNVVEPGTFDENSMDSLETPGLALLMRLPGPLDAAVALELLLDVGRSLAKKLEGELRDERRTPLTAQAISHLRAEVMEFERKRLVSSSRP